MGLALAVLAPQVSAHAGHHTHAHTQMSTDRTAKYDICAQTRNHRLNAHTHTQTHTRNGLGPAYVGTKSGRVHTW